MENVTDSQGAENEIISDNTDEEEEKGEDLNGPRLFDGLTMLDQLTKCLSLDEKMLEKTSRNLEK